MASFNVTLFLRETLHLTLWLVVLAAIFATLERIWALRRSKFLRTDFGLDIFLYFVSSLVPGLVIAIPAAWLLTVLRHVMPAPWQAWAGDLPVAARYAITLLVAELGSYWGHRWAHERPWLWRFHALHHSAEHMDWLVNTRAHPVDVVFMRICALVPLSLLGLAGPSEGTQFAVVATLVTTLWGFMIHANLRLRLGPFEHWLASPFFHHWHHSKEAPVNRNYAATLPVLDRLFGTLHLPSAWPKAYGIAEQVRAEQPTPGALRTLDQ